MRNLYGILGIPVDTDSLEDVVRKIRLAKFDRRPTMISTPNLNFLVASLTDEVLRQSLLASDLCSIDGTPILWLSRLFGIPVNGRVAGADFFDALRKSGGERDPVKVFLFGGAPGVAEAAARSVNCKSSGVICVGSLYPGYGSIEEIGDPNTMNTINASGADFLVVSLGAQKGQAWLLRNQDKLTVPVRSHLGAAINFEGGTLKRAPSAFRRFGFEWLWRIREEPYLWRRYWRDGKIFLALLLCRALPLAVLVRYHRAMGRQVAFDLILPDASDLPVVVSIEGAAMAGNVESAVQVFERALGEGRDIWVDLSKVGFVDPRYLGLFIVVRKCLGETGRQLRFVNVRRSTRRLFRLNAFEYLLHT
jgi:N-acetylglucosaminyldiphosphoundecaprenol N-acetyl-beta-D-mannosaminyltransferase